MQPEKILHSSKRVSLFCLPGAGESGACAAAAPCRHHTVPKRVGKTTLFGMLERGAVTSGGYAWRSSRDLIRRRTHWRREGIRTVGPSSGKLRSQTAPFDRYSIPFGNKGPMRSREGKATALPRKLGQAAASISYPVDFAMNSSRVWQTIAAKARPCADTLISAFRA